MERITTIVKSMKNFAYRDAASEKRPQNLNQAIEATAVVATNEWKYHAELKTDLDPNLPFVPCNIGEINQVVLNLIVTVVNPFPSTEISESAHAFSAICGAFFLDVSQTAVTAVRYDAIGL